MAQNVLLAAESVGLGGVYIGGIRNDPQRVVDKLDIPDMPIRLTQADTTCRSHPAQHLLPQSTA